MWFLWVDLEVENCSYVFSTTSSLRFLHHLIFTNFFVGPTLPTRRLQGTPPLLHQQFITTTTTLVVVSEQPSGQQPLILVPFNFPPSRVPHLTLGLTSYPVDPTWNCLWNLSQFLNSHKFIWAYFVAYSLFCGEKLLFLAHTCSINWFGPDFTIVGPT